MQQKKQKTGIQIPKYTLGEELMSSIVHGIGALLSVAGLSVLVVKAAFTGEAIKIVSSSIFGFTLVLLYCMSTLYHSLKVNRAKKVFRVLDHCAIFFLIAGTYTPISLVALGGGLGWTLFGIQWGCTALGVTLNAIDLKKYSKLSMACYLIMGWCIIFAIKPLGTALTTTAVWFFIAGGIFYTVGAVIYGFGSKVKYMHSIWHFFVLFGSLSHYFAILFWII